MWQIDDQLPISDQYSMGYGYWEAEEEEQKGNGHIKL